MNHPSLVDTHRRYKAGTTKIVAWLVTSAQRLRSSGKKKANQSTSNKVSVNNLLVFAERIVKPTNPLIKTQQDILDILYDVISGRTAAEHFYSSFDSKQQSEAMKSSNASHLHFIEVLKGVQEVLRTAYKARLPVREKDGFVVDAPEQDHDMCNVFAALDIHDEEAAEEEQVKVPEPTLDEKLEGAGLKKKKGKAKKVKAPPPKVEEPEYEVEGIEEVDELLAIWCLLQDLRAIRQHTRGLWQQFKDDDISFLTVSRLTENAVDLTIQRCRDITSFLPKLRSWQGLVNTIGVEKCFEDFVKNIDSASAPPDDAEVETVVTQSFGGQNLFCLNGWAAMAHFCRELERVQYGSSATNANVQPYMAIGFDKVLENAIPFLCQIAKESAIEGSTSKVLGLDNFTIKLLDI